MPVQPVQPLGQPGVVRLHLRAADLRERPEEPPRRRCSRRPSPGAPTRSRSPSPSGTASSGATASPSRADDVAFTFNLMKEHPALDIYALWTGRGLNSVTAGRQHSHDDVQQAARAVLLQLRRPDGIVPKHIWSHRRSRPRTPRPGRTRTRSAPGRTRSSPCSPNNISTPRTRPTGSPASRRSRRSTTRPTSTTARPTSTSPPARRSGAPVHPDIEKFYVSRVGEQPLLVPADRPTSRSSRTSTVAPVTSNLAVRQAIAYAHRPEPGLEDRRVRLPAAGQPGRRRHPDLRRSARQDRWPQQVRQAEPGQGEAAAGERRVLDASPAS